jgi:hypothetical protein
VKMRIGDVNHNNQKLLAKTMQPGTGYNARIWILECQEADCQYRYGANGHDAWRRLCPECQDGMPGLKYRKVALRRESLTIRHH